MIAVSPANLSAYARSAGWVKSEPYGDHSDVYINKGLPEIILPRTKGLGDYAHVVSQLIEIFAKVEDRSQLDVFCDVLKAGSEEAQELVEEIYEQKKRAEEALQEVRWNPSAFPLDRAIANAISLQGAGKIVEAIEKWRSIANIAEEIDNDLAAHAWFSVGYLFQICGVEESEELKNKKAILAYDQVIRLKPDDAKAYNNRGIVKRALGLHEAALADYDQAIRLKPDDAAAYNNRGIEKSTLSRHEDAITDYDQAIRLKPDDAEVYYNRGNAKSILGQPNAAIVDFNQAIDLNPDYAEAYCNRGIAKYDFGQHDAAIADFDRAISLNPSYVSAYNNRGTIKGLLGQHQAAIADYDQAIHLKPDLPQIYNNRGIEKSLLRRPKDAISDFDQAIHLKPDDAIAYYNRGNANAILNHIEEARADFEAALDLADRSGNTDLKSRIEQQLQALLDTDSTSDSIRQTEDLHELQPVYDSAGEPVYDFDSPVVAMPSIQRALVEL